MDTELDVLFSSTARVQILGLFLQSPRARFYQREISRETGQPIRAVQREVERLEGIGLLVRSKDGNRVFHGLNPGFRLRAELTELFRQATGSEEPIQTAEKEASKPGSAQQPFSWMSSPDQPSVPETVRSLQVGGGWDQTY